MKACFQINEKSYCYCYLLSDSFPLTNPWELQNILMGKSHFFIYHGENKLPYIGHMPISAHFHVAIYEAYITQVTFTPSDFLLVSEANLHDQLDMSEICIENFLTRTWNSKTYRWKLDFFHTISQSSTKCVLTFVVWKRAAKTFLTRFPFVFHGRKKIFSVYLTFLFLDKLIPSFQKKKNDSPIWASSEPLSL